MNNINQHTSELLSDRMSPEFNLSAPAAVSITFVSVSTAHELRTCDRFREYFGSPGVCGQQNMFDTFALHQFATHASVFRSPV